MRPPSLEPHPWVSDIKVASSGPNESPSDDQVAPESVLFKRLFEPVQDVEVAQFALPVIAHAFVPNMVTSYKVHGVEVNWSHGDGKPEVRATQVVPPSAVLIMTPSFPTAIASVALLAAIDFRSTVTPDVCGLQVEPQSVDFRMIPPSPTVQHALP